MAGDVTREPLGTQVDVELQRALKRAAAQQNVYVYEALERAIRDYLGMGERAQGDPFAGLLPIDRELIGDIANVLRTEDDELRAEFRDAFAKNVRLWRYLMRERGGLL